MARSLTARHPSRFRTWTVVGFLAATTDRAACSAKWVPHVLPMRLIDEFAKHGTFRVVIMVGASRGGTKGRHRGLGAVVVIGVLARWDRWGRSFSSKRSKTVSNLTFRDEWGDGCA